VTIYDVNQPRPKAPSFFYGYIVVAAAFLIMVVSWGLYMVFGVFFNPILEEFGWTRAMTSGAFSLSSVLHGVLAIAMGGLTDRFGPRVVVTFYGRSDFGGYVEADGKIRQVGQEHFHTHSLGLMPLDPLCFSSHGMKFRTLR